MFLYVHSAGRGHLPLPTLDTLAKSARAEDVRLVIQRREIKAYAEVVERALPRRFQQVLVLPAGVTRLSPTRQWILDNCPSEKFVLFDDDLAFATRRKDDYTKFLPASPKCINLMLNGLETLLDTYAHVGLMAREGGNRVPIGPTMKPVRRITCTRMMRVLGYHAATVREVGARFDRVPTKQDFDMTLQLLRAGYENALLTEYVHNQAGSNTAGGCSAYRDEKMMASSAAKLAKLHPGFVKVVTKETKTSWGGGERVDVQVAWKKAYASNDGG